MPWGSDLCSAQDGSEQVVIAAGRYGKVRRRPGVRGGGVGVGGVEGCVLDSDRTWSFRGGFGRRGRLVGLVGGGLVGVPRAARAVTKWVAVSLDHCSYRAWFVAAGRVLAGATFGVSAPFGSLLGWLLCLVCFALAKKLKAKSSSAASFTSSILPAHVPSLRIAMNWSGVVGSSVMNARSLHEKPFSAFHSSTVSL